jgi:hypothetical protein
VGEVRFPVALAPDLDWLTEPRPEQVLAPVETSVWVDAPPGYTPPKGLARLLAQFTYRPGWRFVLALNPAVHSLMSSVADVPGLPGLAGWVLRIHMKVEDTYRRGVMRDQTFTIALPSYPDEVPDEYWLTWLRRTAIQLAEDHEIDEWFMVAGVRPFDPHKGGS